MKRLLKWVVAIVAGYFLLIQVSYLADPGIRDLHIKKAIRKLNEEQCAEIVDGCRKLYQGHIDSVAENGFVVRTEIPKAAAEVGYKQAVIRKDMVMFRAGAGSFSQVGPIVIICWMDIESRQPKYLALDDGRIYSPKDQAFTENP